MFFLSRKKTIFEDIFLTNNTVGKLLIVSSEIGYESYFLNYVQKRDDSNFILHFKINNNMKFAPGVLTRENRIYFTKKLGDNKQFSAVFKYKKM